MLQSPCGAIGLRHDENLDWHEAVIYELQSPCGAIGLRPKTQYKPPRMDLLVAIPLRGYRFATRWQRDSLAMVYPELQSPCGAIGLRHFVYHQLTRVSDGGAIPLRGYRFATRVCPAYGWHRNQSVAIPLRGYRFATLFLMYMISS